MGEGDGKVVLEDAGYFPEAIALKNSSRRVVDSVNAPAVSTVVVAGSCFSTPRIFMQSGLLPVLLLLSELIVGMLRRLREPVCKFRQIACRYPIGKPLPPHRGFRTESRCGDELLQIHRTQTGVIDDDPVFHLIKRI